MKLAIFLLVAFSTFGQTLVRIPGPGGVYTISANPAYINGASCTSAAGTGCTTGAVSMTGANFLVIAIASYGSPGTGISDSSSNTYYGPIQQCSNGACSGVDQITFYYAPNATVTASMTATLSVTGTRPVLAFMGFSNVNTSSPIGQTNNNYTASSVSSLAVGSITPAVSNSVLVSGVASEGTSVAPSVDSSFVRTASALFTNGAPYIEAAGMGYLLQGSAAAVNPTWSWSGATAGVDIQTSFMPSTTGSAYDMFFNFETSSSGTALTAAIAAASAVSGVSQGASGSFTITSSGGAIEILSACQGPPQITAKNVAGTTYTDSAGTRGLANITITGSETSNMKYTMVGTVPHAINVSTWIWPGIASGDTGYYSSFGPANGNDFVSTMLHGGTIYPETKLNPNGSDDSGNAYTWAYATSTTTATPGMGAKTFTTSGSMDLNANAWVLVTNSLLLSTSINAMLCQVTSDSGTSLVLNCTVAYGSTPESSWFIIPWYYVSEQFTTYAIAATSTTSNTIGTGALTFTTNTSLGLSAGTVVSVFNSANSADGVSGTVTSDSGTSLVINAVNTYGSGTFSSWNVSTSVHTHKLYDGSGALLATQIKVSDPAYPQLPTTFSVGFGGDSGTANNTVCMDGITAQWIGVAQFPIVP